MGWNNKKCYVNVHQGERSKRVHLFRYRRFDLYFHYIDKRKKKLRRLTRQPNFSQLDMFMTCNPKELLVELASPTCNGGLNVDINPIRLS